MNKEEIRCDNHIFYEEQLKTKLKESDERFRYIFEQAAIGICQGSLNGNFTRVNKKFCDIIGYTEAELLNLNFKDITHSDDLKPDLENVDKLLSGKIETFTLEKRYIKKDKSIVWVNLTVSLINDINKKPKYFIGVIEDITERKKSEEALKLSESRLKQAERIGNVGHWEMDVATGKSYWSDGVFCICGIEPGAIKPTGEIGMKLIHPDDREMAAKSLEKAILERKPYIVEKRIVRPNGSIRNILSKGEFIFDENNKPIKLSGTFIDITEQKEVEEKIRKLNEELEKRVEERTEELKKSKEEAERANCAKSSFIANISHELRTPLNITMTYLEYLLEELEDELSFEQKEMFNIAYKNSDRLKFLINDLLDISLLESNIYKFNFSKINLNNLLINIVSDRLLLIKDKDVKIKLENEQKEVFLVADELRFRQVIDNILDNAVKFSNEGEIIVSFEAKQNDVEVYINDSGIGIDSNIINNIFKPFYQGDSSSKKKYMGAGLGLTISERIIKAMDGEISVSNNIDKGCCFKITIPYDCSVEGGTNEKNTYS